MRAKQCVLDDQDTEASQSPLWQKALGASFPASTKRWFQLSLVD